MDSSSGIIRVKQGHSPEISMHIKSIADEDVEDANYKLLTDFSCAKDEVKTDIPLLSIVAGRHSAEPVEEDDMIARGDARSMYIDKLPGGGKGEIELITVKKSGFAGTDNEVGYLYQGGFKYNIELEYDEIPDQEIDAFVYLRIEYEIKNATVTKAKDDGSVYLVEGSLVEESNLILNVSNKYYVFDETSSTMQERTMANGYPKFSTSPDDENVKIFTLQFAKSKKVFYDPNHAELPSYEITDSTINSFEEKKYKLGIDVKDIEAWLKLLLSAITGLPITTTPGAIPPSFDVVATAAKLKCDSFGKVLIEDGNDLVLVAYKSSLTKRSTSSGVGPIKFKHNKENVVCTLYRAKSRNPWGKEELENLNNGHHYETIIEFFAGEDLDKKKTIEDLLKKYEESEMKSNQRTTLQRKIDHMRGIIAPQNPKPSTAGLKAMIVCLLVILAIVILLYENAQYGEETRPATEVLNGLWPLIVGACPVFFNVR